MDERQLNVIVGMAFRPNSAVQDAIKAADQIQGVFQRIHATPVGLFSPQMLQNFGDELRKHVERAVNVDLKGSSLYTGVRPVQQDYLRATSKLPGDPSVYAKQIAALADARLAIKQFEDKASKPLGTPGAYPDATSRMRGELAAYAREQGAINALAKAKEAAAAAEERRTARERSTFDRQMNAEGRLYIEANRRADQEATESKREQEALGRAINAILRRTAAEEKAAEKEEKLAAQRGEADAVRGNLARPYDSPDLRTALGQAQTRVNVSSLGLDAAQRRLAAVMESETRTAEQVIQAERRVEAASAALAAARSTAEKLERGGSGGGGGGNGFRADFMTGFHGRGDRPYAEQIGQAFKFSVFYGTAYKLLFALTQTFQATLQEGIAFQQAITELRIASGQAGENLHELADSLGQRAAEAGFAPSQGVLVGARALGLYGVTDAQGGTAAQQAMVADISARVVSRLAMGSGQDPADLQNNIAAIAQAFGTGAEGQFRIADLDAYMSHFFGVAPGSTIQAVSEAGTVGRAAGFTQEQVTAIAADMVSRTGQTPAAVAGFMAQIFSRGGEGSLTTVAQRYGIDPTQNLADQISQLADVYREASTQERAQISAAFGRGKVQNAAIALLQDYGSVQDAAGRAVTEAPGAADKAFEMRMSNIGGQIALTTGVLKEFANELGQSGMLTVIGGGIVVLREFFEAANSLLRLWNQLDEPIKVAGVSLLALATAARLAGASSIASGAAKVGAGAALMAGRFFTPGAMTGPPPMLAAIAGLAAVAMLRDSSDKLRDAQNEAAEALVKRSPARGLLDFGIPEGPLDPLGPGASADEYRTRASALTASADDVREATKGWMAKIADPFGNDRDATNKSADRLDAEAKRLSDLAAAIEKGQQGTAVPSFISSFDGDALAQSLEAITRTGGTAHERLNALRDALLGTAAAAQTAEGAFQPEVFAQQSAKSILQAITDAAPEVVMYNDTEEDATSRFVEDHTSNDKIAASLQKKLAGLGSLQNLHFEEADKIARELVDESGVIDEEAHLGDYKGAVKKIRQYLLGEARKVKDVLHGVALTNEQLTNYANLVVSAAQEDIGNKAETDYKGRVAVARRAVRQIEQGIAHSEDGPTPQVLLQLGVARRLVVQSEIARLEHLRKIAQQNAHGAAETAARGRSFFRREVAAAVAGRDQDALVGLVNTAGAWGKKIALDAVQDAIQVAKAAIHMRQTAFALFQQQTHLMFTGIGPTATPEQKQALSDLKNIEGAIESAFHGDKDSDVFTSGSDVPGYVAPDDSGGGDKETAAERRAARMAAYAVRSESAIAQARADIAGARAAMAKAKKGTVEYYDALSSYFAARNALTDAILAYQQNKYLLSIDMTDPLQQAQAALKAARDKLRSDRGKGADVRAQDLVDLRTAQAEREATAFQQRLDAIQVAEQLGRTSHQAYLNYLQHEHDRLHKIKDRTFQQQQELNQIDQLLQEAAESMQGQWNFGDIKLPTPYQIRRRVEELFPEVPVHQVGPHGRSEGATTINHINIDGADVGKVKRILKDLVGEYARTTTTKNRHS